MGNCPGQIKNSDSLIIFPLELETVTECEECESDSNDDNGSIFAHKSIDEESRRCRGTSTRFQQNVTA